MAEFGVGFKVFADASQFKREMAQTAESAKALQKGFKDIGVGIGQFIGVGAVISAFSTVIGHAQKVRDESENIGRSIDAATISVARLGDGFDAIGTGLKDIGVKTLSIFTWAGEELGKGWLRWQHGLSDAEIAANEAASRDAQRNLDAMARNGTNRQKEATEAIENAKRLQTELTKLAEVRQNDEQRLIMLKEKQAELEASMIEKGDARLRIDKDAVAWAERETEIKKLEAKIAEDAAKTADKANAERNKQFQQSYEELQKLKFERLSAEEQVAVLERELVAIRKDYNREKLHGNETTALEVELLTKENQLTDIRAKMVKAIAAETSQAVEAESRKIERLIAQANGWLGGMRAIKTGQQLNDASDETLSQIVSRNRGRAQDITNAAIYGPASASANQMEAASLNFEADNAQKILDARNSLRSNVKLGGVDFARSQYQGDPLLFDQMLQRWVTDTRTQAEIARESNTLLSDLNTRLLKLGLTK